MKKFFVIALCALISMTASAQYTSFEAEAPVAPAKQKAKKSKSKSTKAKNAKGNETIIATVSETEPIKDEPVKPVKVPVMKIEEKYRAGSCPEVNGKVQWETTIACPGLSAQQIYDKAIAFLVPYCKEQDKDPNSRIAIVNKQTYEIGARIMEYVVFTKAALSLDRAMMCYTLCFYCSNGSCKVIMKDVSYRYEDRSFPAEEMLLDKNALNKTQTDFHKGGYRKFRTKSVDAKDTIFQKLANALK